jgi:TRAP-type mannitol/chloroaromatic compound transport system permease small subunit
MPNPIRTFVRYVDATNRVIGTVSMYGVFAMIGILLFSSISRTFFNLPFIWAVEMAQFTMAGYYLLGGGFSMIHEGHVRMDLLYGRWSERRQAFIDAITSICLIFYLVLLLVGGISSIDYAIRYGQKNYTPWAPPLAPIKIIMAIGIFLMLLQAIATFFKDVAKAKEQTTT